MKNKYKSLGVLGVFLGIWFSRSFGNNSYFGLNARILIGIGCGLLIATSLIILIIKKFYIVSFLVLLVTLPLVVAFVGMYYDNMNIVLGGLIGFFIILSICLILGKRYKKNKDIINYDKYKNY